MSRTFDAANPRKKFTGKERDTESGNDYFLARYYSSNMGGRFLTPDWSKNPQGVPYANYANPQTLNLYAYVGDNPLSLADADGHDGCTDTTNGPCELSQAAKKNSDAEQARANNNRTSRQINNSLRGTKRSTGFSQSARFCFFKRQCRNSESLDTYSCRGHSCREP